MSKEVHKYLVDEWPNVTSIFISVTGNVPNSMECVLLEKLTGQLVQKSPRILQNPKVHYFVQNSLPQVPKLSQKIPIYTLPFYFFNIHFNIIPPFTPMSSRWSLPNQELPGTSFLPMHATSPSHLIRLNMIPWIIFGEEYKSLSSSLCIFCSLPLLPPSDVQISSSTPWTWILSAMFIP